MATPLRIELEPYFYSTWGQGAWGSGLWGGAVPITQDADRAEIEVDGSILPDVISTSGGYLHQMAWGEGRWGARGWGGDRSLIFTTKTRFASGDYTVRVRLKDKAGNPGAWSNPRQIEHRAKPPAPFNLRTLESVLYWDWSNSNG